MKLIEKYVLRQLVANSMLLFLLIISIFSLSKSVQLIDLSLNRGLPFIYFFKLISLTLPAIIPVILPIIFSLSILFTYSRMRNDSELVIFESSGASQASLSKPVLFYGIFLTLVSLSFTAFISPSSNQIFKALLYSIKNDYSASLLEEGRFNTIGNEYTIFVKKRHSDGQLNNVFIHDTRNSDKPTTLIAKKGSLIKFDNGTKILLENGTQHFYSNIDKKLSVLYFEKYLLNIMENSSKGVSHKWKSPSERTYKELKYPDLSNGDDRNNLQAFKAEIYQRLTLPLNVICFGFLIVTFILSQKFFRVESMYINLKVIVIIIIQMGIFILCSNIAIKNNGLELVNFVPSVMNLIIAIKILNQNLRYT